MEPQRSKRGKEIQNLFWEYTGDGSVLAFGSVDAWKTPVYRTFSGCCRRPSDFGRYRSLSHLPNRDANSPMASRLWGGALDVDNTPLPNSIGEMSEPQAKTEGRLRETR